MKKPGFIWKAHLWEAKIRFQDIDIMIAIGADQNDQETVNELAPIAVKFEEFWEKNCDAIVSRAKAFVSNSDKRLGERCTVSSVVREELGWTVSRANGPRGDQPYFKIYLEFCDEKGSVLGDGLAVKVAQWLDLSLSADPQTLQIEIWSFV